MLLSCEMVPPLYGSALLHYSTIFRCLITRVGRFLIASPPMYASVKRVSMAVMKEGEALARAGGIALPFNYAIYAALKPYTNGVLM